MQVLAEFRAEAPVLAASGAVVLVMVGLAWALGFRARAKISETDLARMAEAEGGAVTGALLSQDGRAALAQLSNGKLMIARVMGDDVSARAAPLAGVRLSLRQGRVSAAFADLGFPPLHIRFEETPPWLAELAKGQR